MTGFLASAGTSVLSFLVVLTVVVTVHELGHFLVARACGVAVDRFSIGFGRPLVSWRDRGGVEWRIGWIPIGGYVRFAGDENEASVPDQDSLDDLRREIVAREGPQALSKYYHFKPVWQRAAIAAAGPAANFIVAILLFALILGVVGEGVARPRIGAVDPGTPAAAAGFRAGDLVLEVQGEKVSDFETMTTIVQMRGGAPTDFVVERGGSRVALRATPQWKVEQNKVFGEQKVGRLGLRSSLDRSDYYWKRYGPLEAVQAGTRMTWSTLTNTLYYIGRIIRGEVSANQISGPLGIAHATGKVAQSSAENSVGPLATVANVAISLTYLCAFISVSIGFMNLLPIPVLDGGHLLFYAYEAVARRPLAARVQAAGYRVGLALVLGLMLFATWNDLQQLRVFNLLGRLFL